MATATQYKALDHLVAAPGKLLVRRWKPAEESEGGIVLPEAAKSKPTLGIVIGLGKPRIDASPGSHLGNKIVRVGSIVYFSPYHGIEIEISGETIVILDDSEILAFIPKPDDQ